MKIYIEQLKLNAVLGVYPVERRNEQPLIVDCEIEYQFLNGAYIDYERVSKTIVKTLKQKKFRLVEDALVFLCNELKSSFAQIDAIRLKITKPQILENASVGAELSKTF